MLTTDPQTQPHRQDNEYGQPDVALSKRTRNVCIIHLLLVVLALMVQFKSHSKHYGAQEQTTAKAPLDKSIATTHQLR
ncbi:MAG: hypothetical protein V4649_16430 [Bacteroidota bacterium]